MCLTVVFLCLTSQISQKKTGFKLFAVVEQNKMCDKC